MEQGLRKGKLAYWGNFNGLLTEQETKQTTEQQVELFIERLRVAGLAEHQVTILVERFVNDKTFREITDEHGFVDVGVTFYLYKIALDQVKKSMTKRN